MVEHNTKLVKANEIVCNTCAAKTASVEGYVYQPWKLGPSNRKGRVVIGRNQLKGTTLRPKDCPHPDSVVSTTANPFIILRKRFGK